jgi:hypothetical protein
MSNITNEKYDPVRIERIRHFLESCEEKGKPKFYEIFVDNLKAVDKTDDTSCFDEYKVYMDDNTQMIKILIYTSTENCPRNDKFIFSVRNPKEEKKQEQLNGLDIQNKIEAAIQLERDRNHVLQLQKELEVTKERLEEAEEYAGTLEEKLENYQQAYEQLKAKKISTAEMNTGRLVGYVTNYFIKNYPSLAGKIPGIAELSGFLAEEPQPYMLGNAPDTSTNGAATFSKKKEDMAEPPTLDPETESKLAFIKGMEDAFNTTQMQQVVDIIKGLAGQPDQIPVLHSIFYPSKTK